MALFKKVRALENKCERLEWLAGEILGTLTLPGNQDCLISKLSDEGLIKRWKQSYETSKVMLDGEESE